VARAAGRMDRCYKLIIAALSASLLIGLLQHWDHMEDRKWRRRVEQEREERQTERWRDRQSVCSAARIMALSDS
jgi:hypothetical protein